MQLSYDEQGVAREGQIADLSPKDVISRKAEGDVPFGRLVVVGTDLDFQAKLPALTGDISDPLKALGVSVHSHAIESARDGSEPSQLDKDAIGIMRKGRVYVKVEQDVVRTDPVFVRHANGDLGAFRKDADGGDATAFAGAIWERSALAGEFAVLELNL